MFSYANMRSTNDALETQENGSHVKMKLVELQIYKIRIILETSIH